MQITLVQAEIVKAVEGYIKNKGLDFGENIPEVTLTAGRGKDSITASIELTDIKTLGPATLEVLPDKKQDDPKLFTPPVKEEEEVVVPAVVKPKATRTKAPAKAKTVKPPVVTEPAKPSGSDSLFGEAAGIAEEVAAEEGFEETEEVTEDTTSDDLFAPQA